MTDKERKLIDALIALYVAFSIDDKELPIAMETARELLEELGYSQQWLEHQFGETKD